MKLVVALVAASAFAGVSVPAIADRAGLGVIHVAVYRGPASCEDCSEAIARAVAKLGYHYRAQFVGPGEKLDITPASLSRFQVYVQPGGGQDIDAALADLGPNRTTAIRQFVSRGGGYVGLCMGAYLAGASDIGLVRDDLNSEVRRPRFPVTTIDDAAVPVRWAGQVQSLYYQDGPYLYPRPDDRGYRPIATYQNGDLAAARYSLGKGVVVLSGPHPEADASWFDDAGLPANELPSGAPFKSLLDQVKN